MEKDKKKQLVEEYKLRKITGGVYIVRCRENEAFFLKGDSNLEGSRNRFEFSKRMNSCVFHQLQKEWKQYGPEAFDFEILEETEQKETESTSAFKDRLKDMEAAWRERLEAEKQQP